MPARATSSGTISFGLVSIPVKLFTATSSKTVRFSMLHETDKSRLRQKMVCGDCGEEVKRDETVRGYEYARDQYVVLTEEEIKAMERKSDRSIEIEQFVPIEKVDPIYFEKTNLLGPDKGGHKAYELLCRAMSESGKVAVGRYASRGREQLVLLRPARGGLLMHGLFYADEVRDFDDIELGDASSIKDGELELANQLIDQLSSSAFDPRSYEDDYRRDLLAAIDRKVAGEEVVIATKAEPREQIIDLVAALKKSLADKGAEAPSRPRKAAKAKGKKKVARRRSAS
jgi:DNA end-binding protein Ku